MTSSNYIITYGLVVKQCILCIVSEEWTGKRKEVKRREDKVQTQAIRRHAHNTAYKLVNDAVLIVCLVAFVAEPTAF